MNTMKDLELVMLNKNAKVPMRSTVGSAGYDVFADSTIVLPKGIVTTVKLPFTFEGKLDGDLQVRLFVRSSFGIKKKVRLVHNGEKNINGITLNLLENEHEISLLNDGESDLTINEDEHFAQFIISTKNPQNEKQKIEHLTAEELGDVVPVKGHMEVVSPNVYEYVLDEEVTMQPKEQVTLPSGFRTVIEKGTWTAIAVTDELKNTIMLANQTPVIDADYAFNPSTNGNCFLGLVNLKDEVVTLPAGTKLTRWYTEKYYILENEIKTDNTREGGIGHTSK